MKIHDIVLVSIAAVMLHWGASFTAAETYYVLPSPCPSGEGGHCLTLSQYAMKPNSYFSLNTTMILLPGNHSLNGINFSFVQHYYVSLLTDVSSSEHPLPKNFSQTIITCINGARFKFFNISTLFIDGLTMVGCGLSEVAFVKKFTLINSNIQGQNASGTGLVIENVNEGNLVNSQFTLHTEGSPLQTNDTYFLFSAGGALIIHNSQMIIQDCIFSNNSVTISPIVWNSLTIDCNSSNHRIESIGGAVSILSSYVTIDNVFFHYNSVIKFCKYGKLNEVGSGGALSVTRSFLQVINSTFTNNSAFNQGGAITAFESYIAISSSLMSGNEAPFGGVFFISGTNISIDGSIMSHNVNSFQGAVLYVDKWKKSSSVNFTNSTINNNKAEFGGSMLIFFHSYIYIYSCIFYNNQALKTGGVVYAHEYCIVEIESCSFKNNTANSAGVISVSNETNATIRNSHFYDNNAVKYSGGALVSNNCSMIIIAFSVFTGNTAMLNGGALYLDNSVVNIHTSFFFSNSAVDKSKTSSCFNTSNPETLADQIYEMDAICGLNDNNQSIAVGDGGVIMATNSMLLIENSTFANNTACSSAGTAYFINNSVVIHNSIFQYNQANCSGGVFYVFMGNTHFDGCIFQNNAALRGGALLSANAHTSIENCIWLNNTAYFNGGAIQCTGEQARYGLSEMILHNISFLHNLAIRIGGALSLYVCKMESRGLLVVNNTGGVSVISAIQSVVRIEGMTRIANNNGSVYAIDSTITFNGTTSYQSNKPYNQSHYNGIIILDKVIYAEGGAMTMFKSYLNFFGTMVLEKNQADNGAAMLLLESTLFKNGTISLLQNTAKTAGGGIYAYQSVLVFRGNTTISNNIASVSGGAIHVTSSSIGVSNGTFNIHSNCARLGGGIYLELSSHIYVLKYWLESSVCNDPASCKTEPFKWTKIIFLKNLADFGGAIYVKDSSNSDTCDSTTPNQSVPTRECFYQNLAVNYNSILNVEGIHVNNTVFTNNTASTSGSTLYGGLLDRCVVSPFAEHFTNTTWYTPVYYFKNITNAKRDLISSDPVRICFCYDKDNYNCSYRPPTVKVVKGKKFAISLVAVDQVNNTVPSTVISSLSSQRGGLSEGETRQNTTNSCTRLNFSVFSPKGSETLELYANGPCKDIGISKNFIRIKFEPCPIGFVLSKSNSSCVCDPSLEPYITNCSLQNNTLFRKGDYWIDHVNRSYISHPHCPFDYCYPPTETVAINFNNSTGPGSDSQCAYNRSGKLCGKCQTSHSLLLGGNRCGECSNSWLWLLIPFALAGIALVVVLLVLNLTVAVGTISGITFYANIVAANYSTFFSSREATFASVFISLLNLDFGFEVCFLERMDAYTKTWLQFIFPLYVISLVVAIIVISEYSDRFAKLFTESRYRRNSIATLATLILLSYTKLLRTVIDALSFTRLTYPNGSHETVWLLDANISYLQGKHIPLFIAAVLVALVGLTYTLVLFSWQVLIRCPRFILLRCWMTNSKLLAFIDAYHAPYNERYRYWTGMLLLLRMVVYLVSAVNVLGDPRVNLVTIITVVGFILSLQAFLSQKPFKNIFCYVLEFVSCVNLLMFTLLTFYLKDSHGDSTVLEYTSVCIAFGMFMVIIVYHVSSFTPIHELPNFVTSLLRSRTVGNMERELVLPVQSASSSCPDLHDAPTVTVVNANPTMLNTGTLDSPITDGSSIAGVNSCSIILDHGQSQESDDDDYNLGADENEPLLKACN